MKKDNVVELRTCRKPNTDNNAKPPAMSKELQLAIKRLIIRLRKQGPLRRVKRA